MNVDPGWLFVGEGPDPEEFRFIQKVRSLSPWERRQLRRLMVRLINGSKKSRAPDGDGGGRTDQANSVTAPDVNGNQRRIAVMDENNSKDTPAPAILVAV